MRLSDFDYALPAELIAQHPAPERTASRLLHVDGARGILADLRFTDLVTLLAPGDLLVVNDTRVIKARLHGRKDSGGEVEVLVERIVDERRALAQVRASKPPKAGRLLLFDGTAAEVVGRAGEFYELRFEGGVLDALSRHGEIPLPPYITHAPGSDDDARYQTVYARAPGAVAAPTAGLHFDDTLLAALRAKGVGTASVTLHVGAGTFQPVRVDDVSQHVMHSEWFEIPPATVDAIARVREKRGRVVAVGTTALRALESASPEGSTIPCAGAGETRLFIVPGYRFRVVDRLITNFHLPRSTLLMLVSAFAGSATIRRAYAHAVTERYRFFSYGDAMLLENGV
ncbi:MAG TPA: tRNA preQ1(34) S-adenosylmethionine ribosyltransferase-isomerase QueA [Usitatibacter sp.]|nr:tRNA preQ1(34) S-adenosylmethionine ribosyltransferase-isomerase QueA [Usitatibacter sp.]